MSYKKKKEKSDSILNKIHGFYFSLVFPPLSLAALKEYRPSITPKTSSASTIHIQKQHHQQSTQQRRKPMLKTDFVWEQSIVSNRHE